MKGVDGPDERMHDRGRLGAKVLDSPAEQLEMAELGDRQLGQGCLVGQGERHRSIIGNPEERGQRCISQQPEQVEQAFVGLRAARLRCVLAHSGSVTTARLPAHAAAHGDTRQT